MRIPQKFSERLKIGIKKSIYEQALVFHLCYIEIITLWKEARKNEVDVALYMAL